MSALEGVRLKLERAEHVIEKLNESVIAYLAENAYEVVGEFEPERSEYVIRGRVTKSSAALAVIAGDVVHNLRSSLDHLAWQLALITTATPFDLTQFPIARTEGEFGSKRGQNMIRDISPKHRALIETFQPYNRSEENFVPYALGDLRVLSNTDKHRLLNTTVARHAKSLKPKGLGLLIIRDADRYTNVRWFPGGRDGPVDGAEVVRMVLEGIGPDPKVKVEGELPVTVSFHDPALTGEYPSVIPMLGVILRCVHEVVAAFESDL